MLLIDETDKADVESFCQANELEFEWLDDKRLRTRQINQASAVHPVTSAKVWFNQAHLFHVTNLEQEVQDSLLSVMSEAELPRNTYYGDGERIDPDTMAALADVAPTPGAAPVTDDPQTAPLSLIVPSFMLSEIQKAFAIGFLVSLPFLIIDLVVSAILMSMGMMMVPPAIVALPFKLAFFVVVDGWGLIAAALVRGYQP